MIFKSCGILLLCLLIFDLILKALEVELLLLSYLQVLLLLNAQRGSRLRADYHRLLRRSRVEERISLELIEELNSGNGLGTKALEAHLMFLGFQLRLVNLLL